MANCVWTEKVLQLLHRMNNFYLPGSCRANCLRFEIDGIQIGWIMPHVASQLACYGDVFQKPLGGALSLCNNLDSYVKRSEAVDIVLSNLRRDSSFGCLKGWRDERYNVMDKFSDPPVMWMERAATSLFGVKRYGVHINGYTVSESGDVYMWLARRSFTKQTYPGLLDNMAAGGLAAGMSIKHTLVKECQEEACIPETLAEKAHPVSTVRYVDLFWHIPQTKMNVKTIYQILLSTSKNWEKPKVGDGEVQEFYLLPIEKVKELLATEDFKPNCAMVVLDFLIRHSFIEPDREPFYQEFVSGLHRAL
ncbi:thiamine pyrophosphokinase 2 isoform 1-T1 [Syngnathus typhle]